jgi:hypothetical protein
VRGEPEAQSDRRSDQRIAESVHSLNQRQFVFFARLPEATRNSS